LKNYFSPLQVRCQPLFVNIGKYYAIVIGINRYEHLSELQTAVNDAQTIGRLLQENFGFEIKTLINENASRNSIVKTINNFRKILSSKDKLLIYYAGHGYFDKVTGKAYWLPTDAEKSDDTNWILAERVTSNLKRLEAKQILIVSDSCYSGTLMRTAQISTWPKVFQHFKSNLFLTTYSFLG